MPNLLEIGPYLDDFSLLNTEEPGVLFKIEQIKTRNESLVVGNKEYRKYVNEFWTPKQRQASSLHEVSYRACFKPQLPRFFVNLLTKPGQCIYDPFSGRGTTVIEAALMGRNVIANDINPLSTILARPRLFIPLVSEVADRLHLLNLNGPTKADIDISMFYHPDTERELVTLRNYLNERGDQSDEIDDWIRMIATNRLTGHSAGYFSVYTLPPNQAVSAESQIKINQKRQQRPEYRNTKSIILKKTSSLLKNIEPGQIRILREIGEKSLFINDDARRTTLIQKNTVDLVVTSPPFLDIVNYAKDNWLRCWFNSLDSKEISRKITTTGSLDEWIEIMSAVFQELHRVVKLGGWVAFEVGELRKKSVKLEDCVVPIGLAAGFDCVGVLINEQEFTKTSNIWGVINNKGGTNSNRVVIFRKPA